MNSLWMLKQLNDLRQHYGELCNLQNGVRWWGAVKELVCTIFCERRNLREL